MYGKPEDKLQSLSRGGDYFFPAQRGGRKMPPLLPSGRFSSLGSRSAVEDDAISNSLAASWVLPLIYQVSSTSFCHSSLMPVLVTSASR